MDKENIIRLLSSLIISIGIIIAGYFISSALSTNTNLAFPNSIHVIDDSNDSDEEFMSIFQAASYLKMDYNLFKELVDSGEFASTYVILNGDYVFSRSRLDDYLYNLIDSKK